MSYESCLDSTLLITTYLNFSPDEPVYEYRHDILEEFLKYPNGLDLIRQGLENLYARDREKAHGFFELVAEREALTRDFSPYYKLDQEIVKAKKKIFREEFNTSLSCVY